MPPPTTTITFEYRIVSSVADEASLNALGADGWELIVVYTPSMGSSNMTYIFKRTMESRPHPDAKPAPTPEPK